MSTPIAGTPVAFVLVTDRERALAFYTGVLGCALHSTDPFGDFVDLRGAMLRVTVMPDHKATPHPVLGWNVSDLVATIDTLRARGVEFTIYPGMGQDERGIWTSPDGRAKVAFFTDPDGNVLSLAQG